MTNTTPDNRPEYKDPSSAAFLRIIAGIILVIGIIYTVFNLLVLGLSLSIIAGISIIVVSCFLYITVNMSCDIHRMEYTLHTLTLDHRDYHKKIIQLIEEQTPTEM